ncbi:hypothetical protein GCM10011416_23480 [Polaribacter pacificus]|uniref:Uncharacterized protein n=1 Tax=Polaribacter pacificus TaxID=1775173 RepID=A0A917MEQ9_9FLAO|nr:glucosaminidase domain-containing protein [Polaribacter pacificus]GGH03754.1 hypothetical protein GCM10011416_23480 [Polaribacter pacificus]
MKRINSIILGFLLVFCFANDKAPTKKITLELLNSQTDNQQKYRYSLRKYAHVKEFYKGISIRATQICLEHNIPPASLLAIAALESGWNKGYIGQITGNILSLGTRRGDTELPALRLPRLLKNKQILFDSLQIAKYTDKELKWENRPESLKKDYRPKPWAGTPYNLAYFKYHPKEKKAAHIANITDFVTVFIARKSKIKAYRDARKKMDSLVAVHGKEILLKEETAIQFIYEIGGKKNSYNFRKTWPKKVVYIIKNAGLTDLTSKLYNKISFENAWKIN